MTIQYPHSSSLIKHGQNWSPLQAFILVFLLVYPWVNPIAPSPSSGVVPWLFSLGCTLVAWLLVVDIQKAWYWQGDRWLAYWILGLVLAILTHTANFNGETVLTLSGLLLLVLAIDIGARAQKQTQLLCLVAYAWFFAAVVSSIIALSQYFNWDDALYPIFNIANQGQAFGNLRQRNQLATLLNIGLAVLVLWPILATKVRATFLPSMSTVEAASSPKNLNAWQWRLTIFSVQLLTAANAASVSRTGMVGVGLLFIISWVWYKSLGKTSLMISILALLSYAFWVAVLPFASEWITGIHGYSLFGRLGFEGLASCTSRKILYLNVLDLILEKPLWGWGWRELSLAHFSAGYNNRFCEILDNAHNLPLHFAVELGLILMALLVLPFIWKCLKAKPWHAQAVEKQLAWYVLALVLLHSMLEYPLWYGPFMLAFGLSLGLLWPQQARGNPGYFPNRQFSLYREKLPGWIGFAGMVGLFFAAYDYVRVSQIYTVPEDRLAIFANNPYAHANRSWLFAGPVSFAVLLQTPVTPKNAQSKYDLAKKIMHYSPEGAVIEVQLKAAQLLGHPREEIKALEAQYKKVYPEDYANYVATLSSTNNNQNSAQEESEE